MKTKYCFYLSGIVLGRCWGGLGGICWICLVRFWGHLSEVFEGMLIGLWIVSGKVFRSLKKTIRNKKTYALTLTLLNLILVKLFRFGIVTSLAVGVTTWKFESIFLLYLLYLPIPVRSRFVSNRP